MGNGQPEASADSITLETIDGKRVLRLDGKASIKCDQSEASEIEDVLHFQLPGLGWCYPFPLHQPMKKRYLAFITALPVRAGYLGRWATSTNVVRGQSFQRKIINARTKGTMHQTTMTPNSGPCEKMDLSSSINARKASMTGVSGNHLITGCTISGNRS